MKQIRKWRIVGLILLAAGILAACDAPGPGKELSENLSQPETGAQTDMSWQETGAQTELTGLEELSWEISRDTDPQAFREQETGDMQRYLRQATVQIQGAKYLGSGVIWAAEEEYLVIATAAHVAADNEPLTVQFVQGEPLAAEPGAAVDRVDLAFLRVDRQQVQEQGIPWQAARQDQEVCNGLAAGEELLIMGSIEETADRIYSGSVTENWVYLEDFDNYMLLGHAYAIPGVSGGGVFTADGILVGILCGGNAADEIAVLPYSVMAANSSGLW